ncbi:Electron transfer flavoprotein alpha/beta-subunit [Sulfolobus islandicus Y.G.57.14]|jgi:electron transfer flavoprotein beta subunit|uniref:Electron transfer flavoprotein alpha/beta-subunit n=4 Tax=Saccharolobus islandicus TaxID=43080 RepID=C3MM20_SACI2|nr:electron transfer flavoprotein subunit beta/FixA family protein [Sulfolobus islandicus]ACP36654.1 Electron transfer flavoprotein alpha/beta-subunit [Sulfolobus islandicus L.S.2.15]ACP46945.1 Electron transfer flavoprotein alpha/beta-subunit [Sulfolobus islandicus Y.G.57.14]ACP47360.1 Electron transfer flavoprotein alpha/beta-subunit [Sulfolobus islandicus Y.N.15.51]ADB88469.1 electron transfer flavoprotein beta-subunit [Sulfolobus islandicus L.D.8.5]PVU77476.1 electron transfer flavoprotein
MNIIVGFKIVPDDQMVKVVGDKLNTDAPLKVSSYDKNAIEEAIRLKEKFGGKVTGITVGSNDRKSIREALAMGVDEVIAILVKDPDVYVTAMAIAENVKTLNPDIILFSEMTTDSGTSALPAYVSELLGLPYISNVKSLKIEGNKVTADRGMVSYIETVESSLPLVVSVGGEINTPRIPSVKQIMESSKKPVKEVKFDAQSKVRIREIKPMIVNRKRIVIEESDINKAVDKLIEYLKSDGVI